MTAQRIVTSAQFVTPPPPPVPKLAVSIPEAGVRLGLCRASIYKLIRTGRLRVVKIGARSLIPVSELVALLGE
jgi:excisionase family DNA binding protein